MKSENATLKSSEVPLHTHQTSQVGTVDRGECCSTEAEAAYWDSSMPYQSTQFKFFLQIHLRKYQVVAQVLVPMAPTRETQMEFLVLALA